MSELDLSQVAPEPEPEVVVPPVPDEERPQIIIVWNTDGQAPLIMHKNIITFEMQIAMLAAATNVVLRRCEEARNAQAQAAMVNAMQNQAIASQLVAKHGPMPPGHHRR